MLQFKAKQKNCVHKKRDKCAYYKHMSQCHFLNCPHFSYKIPSNIKKALKKENDDSVKFNVNDFDQVKMKTVTDIELKEKDMRKTRIMNIGKNWLDNRKQKCSICKKRLEDHEIVSISSLDVNYCQNCLQKINK
jgi:hypothetical protein